MTSDRRLRVLFVDDEPRLLDGLRRSLRAHSPRWDMSFALSGAEALASLAAEPADIVLSDMRMPGMDGAALLAEIARVHPQTIRLIFSGQSDANAARRAIHVAHQFLGKPIAATVLADLIMRLGDIRSRLGDSDMQRRATTVNGLSAVPALFHEVTRLSTDETASIAQLAEVIERDPAMTARLLHLAGSAFVGRPLRDTGVAKVVSYLGLDTLRTIVRDGELAAVACDDPVVAADLAMQQRHAVLVARIARRLVPARDQADDAYAAGLLHDIGKRFIDDTTAPRHADVGAYLLAIWGLPSEIVEAVARHHSPIDATDVPPLAAVTRAANALAHDCLDERHSGDQVVTDAVVATTRALESIGMNFCLSASRRIAAEERAALESGSL